MSQNEPKRIYRDSRKGMLGGICAGIANYFNLDPTIVRIIAVLLGLGYGSGVLLYIILWVIIPEQPYDY